MNGFPKDEKWEEGDTFADSTMMCENPDPSKGEEGICGELFPFRYWYRKGEHLNEAYNSYCSDCTCPKCGETICIQYI